MLTIFLASAIAATPVQAPARPATSASARATVRIVRGAEIRFKQPVRLDSSIARASTIRERDGSTRTASLVEFY